MAATSSELALIITAKNRATAALRGASKDLRGLEGAAAKARAGLQLLKKVGTAAMLGLGVAAAGFAVKGIADFISFEDKMTQSLAIMGDAAQAWRGEMESAAREVALTTTFSAEQAAESFFFLASAGLDAEQSIAALPQVAAFAQAGMFDMALATDLLTDAQSALGLASDDAAENLTNMTRVSDVLVKANTLANASVQQFSEALTNKAGAAIKIVNKDLEEGVAVLAAFADQGVKGAEAGTAFNIVMRELQTKALKNKETFAELNIEVFDSQGKMANLGDIIGDLEGALEGMSDEQKKATLAQLGFNDKAVIFIQTLIGTSEKIKQYEEDLRSAGGMTQEVADKQLESAKAQFGLLGSAITDVGIDLGATLTPALLSMAQGALPLIVTGIRNFIEGITVLINIFRSWPDMIQKVIIVVGALVLALAFLYANPVIAGLGILIGLIILIGGKSREAAARAEALVDALKKGTDQATRQWILDTAEHVTFLSQAMDAGVISLTDLDEGILGTEDSFDDFTDSLRDNEELLTLLGEQKVNRLISGLEDLRGNVVDARDAIIEENEALATNETRLLAAELAAEGFTSESERGAEQARLAAFALLQSLDPALEEIIEDTDAAAESTESLASALLEMASPVFGAISSFQSYEATLERIDEDNIRTKDEMLELALATLEVGAQFDNLSSEQIQAAVDGLAVSLGLSEAAARELLVELGLLDGKSISASVNVGITTTTSGAGVSGSADLSMAEIMNLFRRHGGPLLAGQSAIVGEEGPELFTPNTSGFVHPVGSFGTSSNEGAQEVNIHLHGVDLGEGSRRVLEEIREGIRQLDMEDN